VSADDGIDVVLTWLDVDSTALLAQGRADVSRSETTSKGLDDLETRVTRLIDDSDLDPSILSPPLFPSQAPRRPETSEAATPEWEALRLQAVECLRARAVDSRDVDLDALLDPEEIARIRRRFIGGFTLRTHLDRYDLAIMLIAGLTAALVDYFVMGAPVALDQLRAFQPKDSPLTAFFHARSVDSDNRLSDLAHASFDQQRNASSGANIPGFTPNTHRDLSLGHDALLALVIGVKDVMSGDMTTVGRYGQIVAMEGSRAPVTDPLQALVIVIAHLLSDAFTPMGLPAPGWTLLNTLPYGSLGPDGDTISKRAVRMYTRGYDSRHFLTMSTSVASAELVLRAYWSLRSEHDQEFAEDVRREAEIADSSGVSDHPRYQALAFGAHAAAAGANAGKVVLAGGNTLLINYPEWIRFVQATVLLARGRAVSPTDVLVRRGLGNADALSRGWPDLDLGDLSFPSINLRLAD
jgi:hypothetical protein